VVISLTFNIRDCHAVARNDKNGTFSTLPQARVAVFDSTCIPGYFDTFYGHGTGGGPLRNR